ncbi:DNA topoisomerase 2-associated protein pat1 [Coemansia furcata]|uniref:DNA topoisomerase 2-associated protein pat1 n=1 Tax=Coemansia furcata TaxID=417177 RepID=A0ACC1LP29_9FUNG|nr:DNA topoisomerase 2-associated protein pat1 [Coemansia furcata]
MSSGSFFGTGFGEDPIARERMGFRTSASNDLDAKLESMALEDNLGDQLEDTLDTFNDETFDADVSAIAGQEYDFYRNTLAHQTQIQGQSSQGLSQMMNRIGVPVQQPGSSSAGAEPRKIKTLAEIEAQMVPQRPTPGPVPQAAQPPRRTTASPEVIARRREERLQRQAELSRYDNMMSRHDKDYIIRIQVSQLLTDDPAADDFYCHMYQLSRGALFGPGSMQCQASMRASPAMGSDPSAAAPAGDQGSPGTSAAEASSSLMPSADPMRTGLANEYRQHQQHIGRAHRSNTQSSMARMQQQVQRIVNEARRRPKASHLALEGALGKISVNSARNPKQVIQVQRSHAGSVSQGSPGAAAAAAEAKHYSPSPHDLGGMFAGMGDARNPSAERRKTLRSIENVFSAVLRLEQLIREQVRLPPTADHPSVQAWIASYNEAKARVWAELEASQPISNTYPHPLVRFLSFAKGKRIFPRLVHHMSIDQVLALTTTIIANFETLDVCRFGSFSYAAGSLVAAKQREETDLFLHAVMPPALAFLSETSLQIVNGLFALFMERNNIAWVARTRPALAFLTMFLGRTAALKQEINTFSPDAQELYQATELYGHLFNALRGSLASVFPPAPELGQPVSPVEDLHAWQFLATLAVGASVEQQHTLVAEVREKVLEKVQLAKSGHLPAGLAAALTANVNLFLNALGLDASQVAT